MTTTLQSLIASPFRYLRRRTRAVMVGPVGVGGDNPIRIQSMTTTDTMDTEGTVAQVKRLADVGCEIARITAPTILDSRNLEKIKSALLQSGYTIPLVADIHFRPDAAMEAANYVEKVRVNPGNFVDGKAFKTREYSDEEYADEIKRLEDKFTPLVLKLKSLKRAIRIGTNHGSLSDRIMNRFGDTPLGMVESALEFARICEKNGYRDIIFSMKASNPKIMITAYRLLAQRLDQEGMDYPFHLGVTEAGEGEDGRIKSAIGIGSLLEDGIGDTIRVSLTEDPELEIPVAQELARRYSTGRVAAASVSDSALPYVSDLLQPSRRAVSTMKTGPIEIGSAHPIRILSRVPLSVDAPSIMNLIEERVKKDTPPEILVVPWEGADFEKKFDALAHNLKQETTRVALWAEVGPGRVPAEVTVSADGLLYPGANPDEAKILAAWARAHRAALVIQGQTVEAVIHAVESVGGPAGLNLMVGVAASVSTDVYENRLLAARLAEKGWSLPVLLSIGSIGDLDASLVVGGLICDGIGDAIMVRSGELSASSLDFSYNLLQGCGNRLTKTEYVSCPSCGRTLFDLQSTTQRIKSKTGHLKGVKIAIMGCIVNGPGEMADADFGYVGGGPGKINLYVGKTCVEKSIPAAIADEKLIHLIKSHGKWVEPN